MNERAQNERLKKGEMEFQEIRYGSPSYREALEVRHAVLRKPLGLEWTEEELEGEKSDRHFGLLEEGAVVACLSARKVEKGAVKLRQMAVREDQQGQGRGRQLVEEVVQHVRNEGVTEVFLHAREVVTGFYEALGFIKVGERFEEVGLPHWRMKVLQKACRS